MQDEISATALKSYIYETKRRISWTRASLLPSRGELSSCLSRLAVEKLDVKHRHDVAAAKNDPTVGRNFEGQTACPLRPIGRVKEWVTLAVRLTSYKISR